MKSNTNRRQFLKSALAVSAMPFLPACFSSRAYVANGKVRLAAIGCGAQAWYDLQMLADNSDLCEVVALCDTDIYAPHTEAALARFPNVPRFRDFRVMFDSMANKIDAVLVGTPDHSHFCATMHAMMLGKHVYVEKPLAHSVLECQLLMEAEKKYNVVCQMGNQGHTSDNFNQYKKYVEDGVIHDVTKIVAHMNMERRWHRWGGKIDSFPKGDPMPSTLDWDSWISSAPYNKFSKDLAYGEWRCWFDYGNGCMGDWGAHIIDTAHRFTLNCELPTEIKIDNCTGWNKYVFPIQNTLTMKFPKTKKHGDITLEWWEGLHNQPKPPEGFRFTSNEGLFPANNANDGLEDPRLKPGKEIYQADGTIWQGLSHHSILSKVGSKEPLPKFEKWEHGHWRSFLLACRGEYEHHSPFSVAAPLSQIFCLGVIAQRLNRGFRFNPATLKAEGDEEVNRLIMGPNPRSGWEHYYAPISSRS